MDINRVTYNDKLFIKYDSGKLKLRTPPMRIPFGLEESYGKKLLKLELTNLVSNPNMKLLYKYIKDIEKNNQEKLDVGPAQYKSCLYHSKNFQPLLTTKIEERYGKIICDIISNEDYVLKTIYDFKKNDKVVVDLVFDRLWNFKNKTGCIVKVVKIVCV